jgi:hypothetical protein
MKLKSSSHKIIAHKIKNIFYFFLRFHFSKKIERVKIQIYFIKKSEQYGIYYVY